MGSVAVEENLQRSDSTVPSRNTDIASGGRNESSESCNPFSIRGYVADVRKRDWKKCFPFASDGDDNDSMDKTYELPPIDVPKFRWWQCSRCLQESRSQGITQEFLMPPNHCNSGSRCTVISSRKLVQDAGPGLVSSKDIRRTSKLDFHKSPNHDASTFDSDIGERNREEDGKGLENGLAEETNQGFLRPTSDVLEADNSVASKLKCDGTFESQLQNSSCEDDHLPVVHLLGRKASIDSQQIDVSAIELAGVTAQAVNATEGRLIPLPDLNVCDDVTPDVDEITVADNPRDDEDDDLSSARCPKTRKTRSLSELLGLKENGNTEQFGKDNALRSVTQGEALVNENGGLQLTGQKKRRKTLNDKDFRSLAIKDSSTGTRKIRTIDFGNEDTIQSAKISDSGTEDYTSDEMISKSAAKVRCELTLERNRDVGEKAEKRKADDGGSSSLSRQNATAKGNEDNTEISTLVSSLKKKKMPRTRKEQTPMIPLKNLKPREHLTAVKDAEFSQTVSNHVRSQPERYGSAERPFHRFPDTTGDSPDRDALFLTFDIIPVDDHVVRDDAQNKKPGDSSTPVTAAVTAPLMEGPFDVGRQRSTCQILNSKVKHKLIPEVEGGDVPSLEHMDIDINTIPIDDKVLEQRHSDDIPMDIVELMAKHQHERRGSGTTDKHFSSQSHVKSGRPISGGSSSSSSYGVRPLGMPRLWWEHFPGTQGAQSSNARNGIISGFDDATSLKQKLSVENFPGTNTAYFNISCPMEAYPSGRFSGSGQHHYQEHMSKNKIAWYTKLPLCMEFIEDSGRFGSAVSYQEHKPSDPRFSSLHLNSHKWSGNTSSQMYPHGFLQGVGSSNRCLAASQQNGELAADTAILSQSSDKQKVIHDHYIFNLNEVPIGLGKQSTNHSSSWNTKMAEHSSAMQLLNLMHAGKTRPTPMPYAVEGNSEFLKWPLSRPHEQHNQFTAAHYFGAYNKTGVSSRRYPSLDHGGKTFFPEKPHPCYASNPTASRAFASPNQDERNPGKCSGFTSPISFTPRDQRYIESYHSTIPPVNVTKNLTNHYQLDMRPDERTVLPTPRIEICALNRNPAEFNDPNLSRRYMVGPEDFRSVKGTHGNSFPSRQTANRPEKTLKLCEQQRA
ncbi:hypothetical protein Nepgr_008826 [Nepenthes gracilis]|uniref:Protein EMBRYONIC FLOWER 1-like n=1 Tax=Nepenthes gracilis TaxID=150966 RepID=A0AAD3S9P3_NEPGR|nr:hypothetical protein Nepgr_008826 [Nepenthes gracilis]